MTEAAQQEPETPQPAQTAESQEERVLAALRTCPEGMTDEQIAKALGIPGNTAVPRRNALVKRGLVRDSGERRKVDSGRTATVWVVVGERVEEAVGDGEPLVGTRTARRRAFEVKMVGVEELLETGKSNVEIASILGVSESSVSTAKKALQKEARVPTKLDHDLDRFDVALPVTALQAAALAKRLLKAEPSTKTKEELTKCAKNLAESMRQLRELQAALKLRVS